MIKIKDLDNRKAMLFIEHLKLWRSKYTLTTDLKYGLSNIVIVDSGVPITLKHFGLTGDITFDIGGHLFSIERGDYDAIEIS